MHSQKKTYVMQRSYSWIYSKLLFLLAPPGMVPSHIRNSKVTWHVYPSFSVNWICTAKHYALTLHLHWKAIHSHSFEWRWWCWCLWGTFTKYISMSSVNKSHNLISKWKLSQRKDNTFTGMTMCASFDFFNTSLYCIHIIGEAIYSYQWVTS